MKRVAALWLPMWSIDRICRAEPNLAPPPEPATNTPDLTALEQTAEAERTMQCDAPRNSGWRPGARWARAPESEDAARWARNDAAAPKGQTRRDMEMQIATLPQHQRPPMRMLGRSSEAAGHPFKAAPADEVANPMREGPMREGPMREMTRRTEAAEVPFRGLRSDDGLTRWQAVPSVRYPGDGPHPDKHARRGSNDPHSAPPGVAASFDTGRSMAGLVGQVCRGEPGTGRPLAAAGTALVAVHKIGSRVEVAAASPAATALGITPGMALTQVRASVPDVVVRDADPAGDAADLAALAVLLARRWTPVVAVSDPDGLFLDLTGVAHLYGGEQRFARRLIRLLARHGFAARIGLADTAGAAWALARYGEARYGGRRHDGARAVLCPPGGHAAALAPLPAAALRFEDNVLALLRRLGVETVAEVMALPRAPFARRFGRDAARRLDQALGHAGEPLDPVVPAEAIRVTQRFAEPIATAEAIAHWLGQLVPRLAQALAEAGRGARAILLLADRVDGATQRVPIGLARPERDPAHILRLIARRIETVEPGYGIDALHLHVLRADQLGPRPFDATLETGTPDLGPLIDLIANRAAKSWRQRPVESRVPERSVARIPALDPPDRAAAALKRDDVRRLDTRPPEHPWRSDWPRPVKLLRRPERLDHIMAELPDQPPRRFTWRGVRHVIVRADGPERIAGEWWRRGGERDAVRDYFRVEDESGERFWLFRRGDGERAATGDLSWYLHGRFG